MEQKLQKFLAHAGIASRRGCELLIAQGRVTVNGVRAHIGQRIDPEKDRVRVDGREVRVPSGPKTYIALNKPPGYLSTVKDPLGRKTVMDLLDGVETRVYPVGRLDFDAMGLMLMTNDGELAFRLTHPAFEVRKRYVVEVDGPPDQKKLEMMLAGVRVGDRIVRVDSARFIPSQGRGRFEPTKIEIELHEGQKHVVKNVCRAVGYEPLKLMRVAIGPLKIGELPPGRWRRLTRREVRALRQAAGLEGEERDAIDDRTRRSKDSGHGTGS
ncbi:MAG: rRNA pseudouridine synthase [Firmicutes bacterium]|nr:rRNA pseudouridine synthase [Candidatus Fermentithermobacillaceae bacterium]